MPGEGVDQPCQVRPTEEVGSSAAEVELAHFPMMVEERRDQSGFAEQALHIVAAGSHIARDEPVASTIEAGAGAERNVNIKRQRPRRECRVAAPSMLAI